jgi:cytochrome b subunit of formate dehydrogenase
MSFFKDGDEYSMRRLVSFWAMLLLTLLILGLFSGVIIDTQIFFAVGSIATVSIGAAAIKNKAQKDNNPPF